MKRAFDTKWKKSIDCYDTICLDVRALIVKDSVKCRKIYASGCSNLQLIAIGFLMSTRSSSSACTAYLMLGRAIACLVYIRIDEYEYLKIYFCLSPINNNACLNSYSCILEASWVYQDIILRNTTLWVLRRIERNTILDSTDVISFRLSERTGRLVAVTLCILGVLGWDLIRGLDDQTNSLRIVFAPTIQLT